MSLRTITKLPQTIPRARSVLNYRKWIGSTEFVELISDKMKIGNRQAYKLIKAASVSKDEAQKIKKFIFPDRTVWYGLPEFGQPSSTAQGEEPLERGYKKNLLAQSVKDYRRVQELLLRGPRHYAEEACRITEVFIYAIPPSPSKDDLVKLLKATKEKIEKNNSSEVLSDSIREMWNEIFAVLQKV